MTYSQNSSAGQQEVSRLRELLFGREKQVLSQIEQLVLKHEHRIGSDEAMTKAVAEILADALRKAEVEDHRGLATALSPLVVQGIKAEIKNSRDDMVDAFYPILGRLVSAYVTNSFREFIEETNRRLEGSLSGRFIRLRLQSVMTRTPYQQVVLREAHRLRIEELFLIRKGSGALLDHWQTTPISGRHNIEQNEQLMSSMLTAVNEFATEAFSSNSEELRSMDIGAYKIFLRASSSCLLVVKTSGRADRRIEKLLDDEMFAILEDYAEALEKTEAHEIKRSLKAILPTLAERINAGLAKYRQPPVLAYALLAFILLSSSVAFAWHFWDKIKTTRVHNQVLAVIEKYPKMSGFPVKIQVLSDKDKVIISGLAPDSQVSKLILQDVRKKVGIAQVEGRFSYVPTVIKLSSSLEDVNSNLNKNILELQKALGDIEKDLMTTATAGALKRTSEKLNELNTQLAALAKSAAGSEELKTLSEQVERLVKRLDHPRRQVREWTRSHAIFFGEEDTLRDPNLVAKRLQEFSRILMASSAKIRVIGYTDPTGTQRGNVALAVKRARKVANELMKYGVPSARLKILGRPNGLLLSYDKGPNSSNRRVEFELIYEEEAVIAQGEPLETGDAN